MTQKYLEEIAEKNFSKNHYWFIRFRSTRSYAKLDQAQKANAFYITQAFVGLAYRYQLRLPRRWTATSVKEILMDYFPNKIAADKVFFNSIFPVMRRYFSFLGAQHKISNAQTLINALDSLDQQDFVNRSSDVKYWGDCKKQGMRIVLGWTDGFTEQDQQRFAEDCNMFVPLAVDKQHRNLPDNIVVLTDSRRKQATKRIQQRIKQQK